MTGAISLLIIYMIYARNTAPDDPTVFNRDVRGSLTELMLPNFRAAVEIDSQRVQLGKHFFSDTQFSANGKVSCATCHDPKKKFTDGLTVASGISETERNSPTIIGSVMNHWFFWDGRADSLISQAVEPIENLKEHGISRTRLAKIIGQRYRSQYDQVFGPVRWQELEKLPDEALPSPRVPAEIPTIIFAYALNSISDLSFQSKMIREGIKQEISPAIFLQRESVRNSNPYPAAWVNNWNDLSDSQKILINSIFLNFAKAVAAFEETIIPEPSAFDQFAQRCLSSSGPDCNAALRDDFGEDEFNGFQLFIGRGQCVLCHNGPNFSDQQFHNTGLADITTSLSNLGRSLAIGINKNKEFSCSEVSSERPLESCEESKYLDNANIEHVGAFKTPTLRNVADTAPYFHNGSFKTLEEVIDFYSKLESRTSAGHREESLKPFKVTVDEKQQLIKFLKSLNSDASF